MNETAYKLNQDFTINILTANDIGDNGQQIAGTKLLLGENMIQFGNRLLKVDLKLIETYQNGFCYAIVPIGRMLFKDGEKFIYLVDRNTSLKEDEISRIVMRVSTKDTYLDAAWSGLPGVQTTEFDIDLSYFCQFQLSLTIVHCVLFGFGIKK